MSTYIFPNDKLIAGIDESNRGGLIGEVITACVVLKKAETEEEIQVYNEIKDSKKLTSNKRKRLCEYIKKNALTYGISSATLEEIEKLNILNATLKAMYRATDIAYKKKPFIEIKIDGQYFK